MNKPDLRVRGMVGIGDCIHLRAVIKELMQQFNLTLESYYSDMYYDLVEQGLKLVVIRDRGRIRDSTNRSEPVNGVRPLPPRHTSKQLRLTYSKKLIDQNGSLLAAMFASANLQMPNQPDFSLPVTAEWRKQARALLQGLNKAGKPVMVYRPLVLNSAWSAPARTPDPKAYDALYQSIRDKYYVVSIADLKEHGFGGPPPEWIVGPSPEVNLALHRGELDFGTMVGLFAEASMVFSHPGFAPVMAQAVGTPVVIVYGGHECFRTTHTYGASLTPTLPIDTQVPCDCFNNHCQRGCAKQIDMSSALDRIKDFVK